MPLRFMSITLSLVDEPLDHIYIIWEIGLGALVVDQPGMPQGTRSQADIYKSVFRALKRTVSEAAWSQIARWCC